MMRVGVVRVRIMRVRVVRMMRMMRMVRMVGMVRVRRVRMVGVVRMRRWWRMVPVNGAAAAIAAGLTVAAQPSSALVCEDVLFACDFQVVGALKQIPTTTALQPLVVVVAGP